MGKILKKTANTASPKRIGADSGVADVFEAYPPAIRTRLKALRSMILDVAKTTPKVGPLEEALKWGQPSYLTRESGSGSTIRIDRLKSKQPQYAIFFHCQTDLVATFRELYPDTFTFEKNRAIILDANGKVTERELRHCIGLALTYHLRKPR